MTDQTKLKRLKDAAYAAWEAARAAERVADAARAAWVAEREAERAERKAEYE